MTDPPYGIDYDKGMAGKIKNEKFDSNEKFYNFLFGAFRSMSDVLAKDGAVYIWADFHTRRVQRREALPCKVMLRRLF
jgi:DNA modification methylase